jgi:hypothetical protein
MPEPEYPPDVNAHLWRSLRHVSGKLTCGILIDGRGGIEEWALRTIELLSREPALALASIYLSPVPDLPRRPSGGILYRWLSQRDRTAQPLRRVEFGPPAGVSLLALGNSAEESRAQIAAAGLDVLIWLESGSLSLACDGLSRLGVWYVRCGDPDEPRSEAPYWKEVQAGRPVSTIALEQNTGHGDVRRLAVCHLATQPGLDPTGKADQPLDLAGPLILRTLLDVLDPESRLKSLPANPVDGRVLPPPGNLEAATLVARRACRSALIRIRSRGRQSGWFVAVRNNQTLFRTCQNRFVPDGFRDILSSTGSQLADPFVVDDNGRHWLFVEEIPAGTSKGKLAVVQLDKQGGFGQPVTILERSYHLSYPFVFPHEGEVFMLPETARNHSIELYRATRFPFEWKLEKTLRSSVTAVDTTPLFLDGIWYFWTTSARLGYETFLFWADSLAGEWHYHPCNPICSDVRRARSAGPLFYSQGTLIRPAQDCSVRYGYGITLNRVLKISPAEYEEELIETIDPKWRKGLRGTHTLSSNSAFEAIDGLRYIG